MISAAIVWRNHWKAILMSIESILWYEENKQREGCDFNMCKDDWETNTYKTAQASKQIEDKTFLSHIQIERRHKECIGTPKRV